MSVKSTSSWSSAQQFDKRAFELLVTKYQRKLGRLLSRFIQDPAELKALHRRRLPKPSCIAVVSGESAFYTGCTVSASAAKNHLASTGRRMPVSLDAGSLEDEGLKAG